MGGGAVIIKIMSVPTINNNFSFNPLQKISKCGGMNNKKKVTEAQWQSDSE